MIRVLSVALLLSCIGAQATAPAQTDPLRRLEDEAVTRVQEYLRVNTVNPPGNESLGVEYLARLLAAEGIPYETVEPAPGRGSIWARLDGGPEPALVLLHHIDVVSADPRYWSVDPFAGVVKDGHIYGRGALDTKTLGILHLQAFLALHREGKPLRRPVIFMATADEEAGGAQGAGWLVENRPELFAGVGMLLNEGGGGGEIAGRQIFEVEVTQKVPLWLRLVARDVPGHGSTPRATSSVGRLVRALERVRTHQFEPRLVPAVDAYFRGRAAAGVGPFAEELRDPAAALRRPGFLAKLQLEDPYLAALTRNACSITRLEGSDKINVVPPQATAEIDCRLLPDQDVDAFVAELRTVLGDPDIEVERIMAFAPHRGRIDLLAAHLDRDPDLLRRTFRHREIYPAEMGCREPLDATVGTPLDGTTLLHMCVDYDELEIARWLIAQGADVNARAAIGPSGFGGYTPLFNAVVSMPNFWMNYRKRGPFTAPFAELLLEHGADPNARASIWKRLHPGHGDPARHDYRDVTPLAWGRRFHAPIFVSEPALRMIEQAGGE